MIRPLGDGVVVEPLDLGEKSSGGLHIPQTAKHRSNEAVVVAVGPGKMVPGVGLVPVDVKEGDRVLFLRWSAYAISFEGRKLLSLHEADILCVVDKEDDVEVIASLPS